MLSCWALEPDHRPSFASLSVSLQQIASDQEQEELELTPSTSSSSSRSSGSSSAPDSATVYLTLNAGDDIYSTGLDSISLSDVIRPVTVSPQPSILVSKCYARTIELAKTIVSKVGLYIYFEMG